MSEKTADPDDLFGKPDSRSEIVSLQTLLNTLARGRIGLPAFQRGQAWDVGRIAFLWDSMLRRYPIGSLMLIDAERVEERHHRHLASKPDLDQALRWLLLDGQQRCAAIALAEEWCPEGAGASEPEARLWVDLAAFEDGLPSVNAPSPFYLTTLANPWGTQVQRGEINPANESEKQDARARLNSWVDQMSTQPEGVWRTGGASAKRNGNQSDRPWWVYPDPWISLRYTWPEQATLPVPVPDLVKAVNTNKDADPKVAVSTADLPNFFPWHEGRPLWNYIFGKKPSKDFQNGLLNALKSIDNILKYEIVLVRVILENDNEEDDDETIPDRLNDIFQRINRQGARLNAGELFFSTVKVHYPKAHTLVQDIHRDESAGKVLDPIEIIHGVARATRSQPARVVTPATEPTGLPDLPRLTLNRYKNLVSGKKRASGGEESFLSRMYEYLEAEGEKPRDGDRKLKDSIISVRRALSMPRCGGVEEGRVIGLPLTLMARLDWRIWHTMIAWALRNEDDVVYYNRKNLIRYALVDHLFNSSPAEWGIRFKFLKSRLGGFEEEVFPDVEIIRKLAEEGYLYAYAAARDAAQQYPRGVLSVDFYKDYLKSGGFLKILHNERDLLFWAQRETMSNWFDELYDPLYHVRRRDKPFDVDHIVPWDWFNYVKESGSSFKEARKIRGSLGNVRIWPKSLNRSEGNRTLTDRLLVDGSGSERAEKREVSEMREFWGVQGFEDVQLRSAIYREAGELEKVERAYGARREWDEERCNAFVRFVHARQREMYRELYEALDLGEIVSN